MLVFGKQSQSDAGANGCFIVFAMDNTRSRGCSIDFGGEVIPNPSLGANDPIIVNAVSFVLKENFAYQQCFKDTGYLYAFGLDRPASAYMVTFLAYLQSGSVYNNGSGGVGGKPTRIVDRMVNQVYSNKRVYKNPDKKVILKVGASGSTQDVLKGYLVGMESSTYNAENNIQSMTATVTVPELQ